MTRVATGFNAERIQPRMKSACYSQNVHLSEQLDIQKLLDRRATEKLKEDILSHLTRLVVSPN